MTYINNKSLHLTQKNKKTYLTNYVLSDAIKQHLLKKGFFIQENTYIVKQKDTYIIKLGLFYRTNLLIDYRENFIFNNVSTTINNLIKTKKTNILIDIKCLNRPLNIYKIKKHSDFLKFYKKTFFERNYNLWLDFIKTLDLIVNKQLGIETFLFLLCSTFKHLNKRKHNQFKLFVSQLFKHILNTYPTLVRGFRLSISGRLQAKTRSSSLKIEAGRIDSTKHSLLLHKSQMHVYTIYGAFGLKLYINFKS